MRVLDAIRKVAADQPVLTAVTRDGMEVSYARFWRDIVGAASDLAMLLPEAQVPVGIAMQDGYAQFVALLAVQSLGYAPVLFDGLVGQGEARRGTDSVHAAQQLRQFRLERLRHRAKAGAIGWVVTDVRGEPSAFSMPDCQCVKWELWPDVIAKGPLSADVAQIDPLARLRALAPDAPIHVDMAFGRDAMPRFIARTRQQFEHWIDGFARVVPKTRRARYLVVGDALHGERFARVMSAWARADQVIFERRVSLPEAVALHHPEEFSLTAPELQRLVNLMPAHVTLRNAPQIQVLGGGLSVRLQRQAVKRLGGECISSLMSPESGAFAHAFGMAPGDQWCDRFRLVDWVRAQVVDSAGEVLADKQTGALRLEVECMAQSCWGPQGRRSVAQEGWFHTGDRGALLPGRVLQLAARAADEIDFDGVPVNCRHLEEALLQISGVVEAAVFAAAAGQAGEQLHVVVVPLPTLRGAVQRAVERWITEHLAYVRQPRLLVVGAIPRTGSGAVVRGELLALEAASARRTTSSEGVD